METSPVACYQANRLAIGARAIHETLPDNWGHARLQIIQCFNDLAHDELAGLCGVCHYRNGACCLLRPAADQDREPVAGFQSKRRAAQLA